ncbi:MAG: hypothetical protein COA79_18105 [Planctomycetota bacterium]|nr:MAG: hypothetical protein COA79_18105 [Planctomycetota bacterium]
MKNGYSIKSWLIINLIVGCLLSLISPINAQDIVDPYEHYIKNSKDFKKVKQDKDWAWKAWPGWYHMPWYGGKGKRFKVGFNEKGAEFSLKNGYNGGMVDWGDVSYLSWLEKNNIRFSSDHAAGKGDLHITPPKDKAGKAKFSKRISSTGFRGGPKGDVLLNKATMNKLKISLKKKIDRMKGSPLRSAYGLDDEISWGSFVKPCMWQLTSSKKHYKKWLEEIYGKGKAPSRKGWFTYSRIYPHLPKWTIKEFDASSLMDQLTFNDSYWCNFLQELVEYGNSLDPDTPIGFVGGQSPNAFGGFDYAKLMRKIQFIEAYNLGSSQAVIRSFNPRNALPAITTIFAKNVDDTIWQNWYYMSHGNRGFAAWIVPTQSEEKPYGWFKKDDNSPADWHKKVAKDQLEVAGKISKLMYKAEWIEDKVGIYYSHASIQMAWILDAEPHKSTWKKRNRDHLLGGSHLVRHAWQNMLRDEGLQYNFISYVDVIQKGFPKDLKVLILPAVFCLSDAEARMIQLFCKNGGTVIADYMPGLWDQHGKGRAKGGVLDSMFNVKHSPDLKGSDIFQEKYWCEVNQDTNYTWFKAGKGHEASYKYFLTNKNTCIKEKGYHKAVRKMAIETVNVYGKGKAVLMNLSPQWYSAYRTKANFAISDHAEAKSKRNLFMKQVRSGGATRWIDIKNAGTKEFGYEITYFEKGDRTIVFLVQNAEIFGNSLGGGNTADLKKSTIPVTLKFTFTAKDVINERSGKKLGDGKSFDFQWQQNTCVVLSFKGHPYK